MYARKVQALARKYPFISFVPSDVEWYQSGVEFLDKAASHQLRELEQDFPTAIAACTNIGSKASPRWHPYFPFSSIRDTASDLVRQVADGEVSATFLMHGKPVKEDDLIDLYTKRPFARVFEALRQLQETLKPVFDAAPESVTEQPPQQYTPTNKRERIVELKKEGKKVSQIMEEVGVSRMTVLRTLEKLYFKTKKK